MPNINYGRLETALLSLGFALRGVYESNKVYTHAATGALITLPEFPADEEVIPRHLAGVKGTLDAFGIADATKFDATMLRAS